MFPTFLKKFQNAASFWNRVSTLNTATIPVTFILRYFLVAPSVMSNLSLDCNIWHQKVKQQCPAFPFFGLRCLDHEANVHADKKVPLPLLCQTVRTPLLSWIKPFSFLIKGSFYPPFQHSSFSGCLIAYAQMKAFHSES